jgi:hypothetical protein
MAKVSMKSGLFSRAVGARQQLGYIGVFVGMVDSFFLASTLIAINFFLMTHKHDQLTVCEGEHPIQVEAHAVS